MLRITFSSQNYNLTAQLTIYLNKNKKMTVNLFYLTDIGEEYLLLKGDEFRHCTQSFRHGVGSHIRFTDGRGLKGEAVIETIEKKELSARILSLETVGTERNYQVEIAIAPTKNINRMEWLVEKSIELGVDRISFLLTYHSERKRLRLDRMERIAVAALKQSRQYQLPDIQPLQSLSDYFENDPVTEQQNAYIAHYQEGVSSLKTLSPTEGHYRVLIGPEGDFSPEEVALAKDHGWTLCTLGDRRLRTETAALSAVAYYHWLHL